MSIDWGNVEFSGECSFGGWLSVMKAWSVQGIPVIQRTVKHAIKVHVWGCFNVRFGTLCLFTDNLNAVKMKRLHERGLLTSGKKWFGKYSEDTGRQKTASIRWIGHLSLQMPIQLKTCGHT